MASLIAAHRGYEYQDLLVACRLVDVLLGSVVQVHVDEKLTEYDRFVTWRAEYDTSENELARPRIRGSGIVIRPDLLDRLATAAGEQRLVLRSFVVGAAELAGKAS